MLQSQEGQVIKKKNATGPQAKDSAQGQRGQPDSWKGLEKARGQELTYKPGLYA